MIWLRAIGHQGIHILVNLLHVSLISVRDAEVLAWEAGEQGDDQEEFWAIYRAATEAEAVLVLDELHAEIARAGTIGPSVIDVQKIAKWAIARKAEGAETALPVGDVVVNGEIVQ